MDDLNLELYTNVMPTTNWSFKQNTKRGTDMDKSKNKGLDSSHASSTMCRPRDTTDNAITCNLIQTKEPEDPAHYKAWFTVTA